MTVGNLTLPTTAVNSCNNGITWCFAHWASDATTGLFWFLALFSFVIIILISSMRWGGAKAFGFATFVGMIGGIFLSVLKLIPWWAGSTFIIFGLVGLAVMIISGKD